MADPFDYSDSDSRDTSSDTAKEEMSLKAAEEAEHAAEITAEAEKEKAEAEREEAKAETKLAKAESAKAKTPLGIKAPLAVAGGAGLAALGSRFSKGGGIGSGRSGGGARASSGENLLDWLLFLFAILAYALQLAYRTSELFYFIYPILAILIWVFRDLAGGPKSIRTFGRLFTYLLFAAAYGFLGYFFGKVPYEIMQVLGFFYYFFPIYPTYIAWTAGENTLLHKTIWAWMSLIFILLVIALIMNYQDLMLGLYDSTNAMGNAGQAADAGKSWFLRIMERMFGDVALLWGGVKNPDMKIVEDPYYTNGVEEGSELDLGVFIEDFGSEVWDYYWDEEIAVFGDIRSESLLDSPIYIDLTCNASYTDTFSVNRKQDVKQFEGFIDNAHMSVQEPFQSTFACTFDMTPEEMFMLSEDLQQELSDYYDENPNPEWNDNADPRFAYNSIDVTAIANFTFSTWGSIEFLFMDRDQNINFQRLNKDLFTEYDISDVAEFVYTRGPVSIRGRNTVNPISVESNRTEFPYQVFAFGATIDNNWYSNGKIKRINNIMLHIPSSLTLETNNPEYKFCQFSEYRPTQNDNRHTNAQYRYYMMDKNYLHSLKFGEKREYMTLLCPVYINNKEDYELVLGIGGVSYNTFVVEVDYEYELKEETSVSIEFDPAVHA